VIALAAVFDGLTWMVNIGILFTKKSFWRLANIFPAAAVNVALNILLIPRYGVMGAAWAALAGFFTQNAINLVVCSRLYYVPYEYRRALHLAVVAASLYAVSVAVPIDGLLGSIVFKLCLLALYPALLLASGFLSPAEIATLKRWVGALRDDPRTLPPVIRPVARFVQSVILWSHRPAPK
jgi:O-antigen/teichoic acid export membrane protein